MITFMVAFVLLEPMVEPEEVTRRQDGETITVEDAVSSVLGPPGRRQIRLRRCPQVLIQYEGQSPREIAGNIRVTGTVRTDAGSISIIAERVETLPSDDDVFDARAKEIAPGNAEGWYALSEWALGRYRLYDDEKMKEKGTLAYRKGLATERSNAAGDVRRLTLLRDRLANQRIVKDPDLEDLEHEILRARWTNEPPSKIDEVERFADEVARVLDPERTLLPPAVIKDLRIQYEKSPLDTFRAALPAERRSLARYWEVSLRQKALEARVQANELSPYEAGEWALQHLRDYPEVGRKWIQTGVNRDEARLLDLSSRQVENMVDHIRLELDDPKRAEKIQSRWLEGRWERLQGNERRSAEAAQSSGRSPPKRDARARFELASLRLTWQADNQDAVAWAVERLKEAAEIEPGFEEPQTKLRGLGYRRMSDGRWLSRDESAQRETAPTIAAGMAPEEVQKILGLPDEQSAVITRAGVESIWTYQTVGTKSFIVFRGSHTRSLKTTGAPINMRSVPSGK